MDQAIQRLSHSETPEERHVLEWLSRLGASTEGNCDFLYSHARRTARYAVMLAEAMGLSPVLCERIRIAALVHDVGKCDLPSEYISRPGSLSAQERSLMQYHPAVGARLVEAFGLHGEVLAAVRHHHERWDGSGYGDGLRGHQIPFGARIIALTDGVDTMLHDQPYREPLPFERVRRELLSLSGVQFDPVMVKAFLPILERLGDVSEQRNTVGFLGAPECIGTARLPVPGFPTRRPIANHGTPR